jgi:signal transduction histidine kinase
MAEASTTSVGAAVKRRGHLRLIAFFAAVAAAGSLAGAAWLGALGAPRDAIVALIATVAITLVVALVGVIFHRSTIAKIRWRETDDYLARIERESEKYHALMEGAADMLLIVDPRSGLVRESNAMAREALGLARNARNLAGTVERERADVSAAGVHVDDSPASSRTSSASSATAHRADIGSANRAEPGAANRAEARAASDASREAASGSGEPPIDSIVMDADRARFRAALARAESGAESQASLSEVRLRSRDRTLVADARFAAIDFGGERVIQVSLRDRSKEKEMERQLQIRERLSSIGLLTAGVAHEINNPLEGIGNYIALLEKEELGDEQRARYLELVRHGFARIADLVRDLLRFARPAAGEGSADLAGVVDRALKLVAYTETFKGVDVERVGLDRPILVIGDSGRLEQVVFNLLLNAANAMGSRGKITIRAGRAAASDDGAAMIDLMVEDEGPGMQREHIDRIFDPFFTTSGGTGLGLAVSYGIVRAHGGTLRAENRSPRGARFTMSLPWPGAADLAQKRKPA